MTSQFLMDAHVHLQDRLFADDLPEVLLRAKNLGINRFICNGTGPEDWSIVQTLAETYLEIIPCFGLHPWYVDQICADWEEKLISFLDRPTKAGTYRPGVGEIGLDHAVAEKNHSLQEGVFCRQLTLAKKRGLPIMLHSVRAVERIRRFLKTRTGIPTVLLHSFSGPFDQIGPLLEHNCYFSFSPNLLNENNRRVREAAIAVPQERILLESDAPALSPRRGKRNEPAVLPEILKTLADLRGIPSKHFAEILFENTERFLSVWPRRERESCKRN